MLVDFSLLKSAMAKVLALLDHSDLNEIEIFDQDPSAERIAKFIFDSVKAQEPGLPLSAVEVFETETSMARYAMD